MPYGKSIYGISSYGQLELPIFDKVGGLIRFSENVYQFSLIRTTTEEPPVQMLRESTADHGYTLGRFSEHLTPLQMARVNGPEVLVGLMRNDYAPPFILSRDNEDVANTIVLIRSSSDFTQS